MIREHPVIDVLDLEIHDGAEWVRWTDPLTSVSVIRGGQRSGPTQTVDVGTFACTFVNAADPLVNAREIPEELIYSEGFTTGLGGWTGDATWNNSGDYAALDTSGGTARYLLDGLEVGRDYIFRAYRSGSPAHLSVDGAATYAEVQTRFPTYGHAQAAAAGMSYEEFHLKYGTNPEDSDDSTAPTFSRVEMRFAAVTAAHELRLVQDDPGVTSWDRVQVYRAAYTEPTPTITPNQPVRLISTGETPEAVWTGTTHDLASTYVLDKNTGITTTFVSLSAVDAVSPVAGVTRYGAVTDGGIGYEPFADRINRLAASAPAGVTVEHVETPTEILRYAL